jgi:hypothetical protein
MKKRKKLDASDLSSLEVGSPEFGALLQQIYSETASNDDWHDSYDTDHLRDAFYDYEDEAIRDAIMEMEAKRIKGLVIDGVQSKDIWVELENEPQEDGEEWRWEFFIIKDGKKEQINQDSRKLLSLVPIVMSANPWLRQHAEIGKYDVLDYLVKCGYSRDQIKL